MKIKVLPKTVRMERCLFMCIKRQTKQLKQQTDLKKESLLNLEKVYERLY